MASTNQSKTIDPTPNMAAPKAAHKTASTAVGAMPGKPENIARNEVKRTTHRSHRMGIVATTAIMCTTLLAGCAQQTAMRTSPTPNATPQAQKATMASDVQRVIKHSYNPSTHTVDLTVRRDGPASGRGVQSATAAGINAVTRAVVNGVQKGASALNVTPPVNTAPGTSTAPRMNATPGTGTVAPTPRTNTAPGTGTVAPTPRTNTTPGTGTVAPTPRTNATPGVNGTPRAGDGTSAATAANPRSGVVEDLLNVNDAAAISNYATAMYPNKTVKKVRVHYTAVQPLRTNAMGRAGTATLTNGTPNAGAVAADTAQYVVTNNGWVGYHSLPRESSPVLGRLQLGNKAPLVQKVNNYWYEIHWSNKNVYITTNSKYTHLVTGTGAAATTTTTSSKTVTVPSSIQQPTAATPAQSSGTTSISLPPPGVHWDTSITPVAGKSASVTAKTNAVLAVAKSKVGTPYIWGHNEDRGQNGFDCSNFTEYVYHHALGYSFTTASRGQYKSVGVTVPKSQMRVGDLLIFNKGSHVGIYYGNNKMIEEGGGLGKVGYLSVASSSYWGKHLSAVRRMY